MRQMRSAMLETMSADYVRTARSKGLSERQVVLVHALRNSLVTVVTVLGPAARRAHLRRRHHRADLRHPRLRQAHRRRRLHPRLPGHPGRRARDRLRLRPGQPAGRPDLLVPQPPDPRRRRCLVTTATDDAARRPRRAGVAAGTGARRPAAAAAPQPAPAQALPPPPAVGVRPGRAGAHPGALAVFAPLFGSPEPQRLRRACSQGPSGAHPLGTDDLGRDTLARIAYGARVSMQAGVMATLLAHGRRRAARAGRRLLPRLGRPGHQPVHRPAARLPVPHPGGRPRRDPRARRCATSSSRSASARCRASSA